MFCNHCGSGVNTSKFGKFPHTCNDCIKESKFEKNTANYYVVENGEAKRSSRNTRVEKYLNFDITITSSTTPKNCSTPKGEDSQDSTSTIDHNELVERLARLRKWDSNCEDEDEGKEGDFVEIDQKIEELDKSMFKYILADELFSTHSEFAELFLHDPRYGIYDDIDYDEDDYYEDEYEEEYDGEIDKLYEEDECDKYTNDEHQGVWCDDNKLELELKDIRETRHKECLSKTHHYQEQPQQQQHRQQQQVEQRQQQQQQQQQ